MKYKVKTQIDNSEETIIGEYAGFAEAWDVFNEQCERDYENYISVELTVGEGRRYVFSNDVPSEQGYLYKAHGNSMEAAQTNDSPDMQVSTYEEDGKYWLDISDHYGQDVEHVQTTEELDGNYLTYDGFDGYCYMGEPLDKWLVEA